MKQFEIFVPNKITAFSEVCDIIASASINIKAIATENRDDTKIIKIVTNDEKTTEKVLKRSKLRYEVSEILPVSLIDRPGELAKLAKMFSKAKISIDSVYILGKENGETQIAIKSDNMEQARKLIKKY